MPDLSTLGWIAGAALVIVVLVWFAVGTIGNIRKGERLLKWLEQGLPTIGTRTTLRWLGSSAVELKIDEAKRPLKAAEVVVVLEQRDVGVFWAWGRVRGRRDFLILRGELPAVPRFELEAGDVRGWTGRDGLRRDHVASWAQATWGGPDVRVAYSPTADHLEVRRHWDDLGAVSGGVWRLSVRRDPPHLEVHVLLPDVTAVGSARLVRAFVDLAGALR